MQKFYPLVSIVIPVYNGSNYMREAIDSAIAQTYKNIEIIVVNDGSNDNCATDKIAKSYGDKIRYFTKPNGGVATALNYAISKMKGEYFSWLSHDDVYFPNKVEYQIEALRFLDDKETILYSSYELIDEKSNVISVIDPASQLTKEQLESPLIPVFRGLIHGCCLLIPSRFFRDISMFDETLKHTQDYRLWFEFLKTSKIHFCNIPLIQGRLHGEQTCKEQGRDEECSDLWIELLNQTSEEQMIKTEGSCYAFIRKVEFLLENLTYKRASDYVRTLARDAYGKDLVSIIIPVYNRIELAIRAINSALNQTYPNIEIIIVNDGSTEDVSKLEQLSKSNSKIKYFEQNNLGRSAARNLGIEKSTGQYIAFLDADDLFKPNKLELQLKKMIDDDCYMSHTAYNGIDKRGNFIVTITPKLKGDVFKRLISECTISASTVLLRRSLLENDKFREDIDYGEDACLWIDLMQNRKLSYLEKPLSDVFVSEGGTVDDIDKNFKAVTNILHHILSTKDFNDYKYHINDLLKRCVVLSEVYNKNFPYPKEQLLPVSYFAKIVQIFKKLYLSIKNNGFYKTIIKIFYIAKSFLTR